MRSKKALKITVAAVLAVVFLCAALLTLAGNYFYAYALHSKNGRAAHIQDGSVEAYSEIEEPSIWNDGGWLDAHATDVYMESGDGLTLHGYRAGADGHRYAILAHGYSANARSMAWFGRRFYERGYTVLLPDLRGHGQSEGAYIGMGWPDRLDMLRWIDGIVREDPEAEIVLHGISMGGATVMMTAGEPLPQQVKAVIEDCGYTSVWDEFAVQARAQFGLPAFPIMNALSVVTKLRAGFWLRDADAVKQVAKAQVPMLFIHGAEDTFVPFWMLQPLYEAATCEKEMLVVPGAGHGQAASVDPDAYWGTIDTFLQKHMTPVGI